MLTEEMKQLIRDHSAGSVATINENGTPSVSPKATFVVLDDSTIAFGNIRSPGTIKNLSDRPAVEVSFLDVIQRKAVRVSGTGSFVRSAEADGRLVDIFKDRFPDLEDRMSGFVIISIRSTEFILSPAYDRGETEESLRDKFLAHFNKL